MNKHTNKRVTRKRANNSHSCILKNRQGKKKTDGKGRRDTEVEVALRPTGGGDVHLVEGNRATIYHHTPAALVSF